MLSNDYIHIFDIYTNKVIVCTFFLTSTNRFPRFIEHVTNATINNARDGSDVINWGPLHLIGHSLGAHICGFAAKELKKRQNRWTVSRITGLDPAQPCFRKADASLHLHKNDAPFVDVIHTNGQLLTRLGLGLPETIGNSFDRNSRNSRNLIYIARTFSIPS